MLEFFSVSGDFTRRLTDIRANAKFSSPMAGPEDYFSVSGVFVAHCVLSLASVMFPWSALASLCLSAAWLLLEAAWCCIDGCLGWLKETGLAVLRVILHAAAVACFCFCVGIAAVFVAVLYLGKVPAEGITLICRG